ncbi:HD domain-containing phosphohydrolase [Rhodanobacter aciditrophus]|uniref:HD domain-containing phosphohydrolase n=1 Tax=Rhodanobacter aciditrophus TaxID=1623218 RepID=UPI003CF97A37
MDVVIVDDQASARTMLRHIVQDIGPQLVVHDFGVPQEALDWCEDNRPDLLLLDYRMPGMDGLELAKAFRKPLRNRDVPIVLVTVVGDEPVRQAALDAGVIDFLVKPIHPRELRARCRNLLQLRQQSESIKQRSLSLEQRLLASMHEVEERERETLSRLARAIELRDAGTSAFLERMSRIAGLIAEGLGLPEEQVRMIELAAPLHDIGKIAIPDAILLKPGPLDAEERSRMQQHPRIGYKLLQDSQSRFIQAGALIALRHHEHWDGTGYPDGLAGEQIPIEARVTTVADVLDALLSPRPYKEAWSIERSLEFVGTQSGALLDPACVRALMANLPQLHGICERYSHVPLRRDWR